MKKQNQKLKKNLIKATAVAFLFTSLLTAMAAENAALVKYGAYIDITCTHPKPLNTTWAKPADLLRDEQPAGPIIHDLATARITLGVPVPMHFKQAGFALMGIKQNMLRASQVEVLADGKLLKTLTLDIEKPDLQMFDIPVTLATRLEFVVKAVLPAPAPVAYGGFGQIVAIVEDDLAARFAPPKGVERPVMVMPTANLGARPRVVVQGQPRKVTGYPRTIWDAKDIADMKAQIASQPAAKAAYVGCIAFCEKACATPVVVPEKSDEDTDPAPAAGHTLAVNAIANLGIGYALSGDERYAREARRILLRYADLYEGWPVHGSPKFAHDKSKWSWQRLNDAIWLIPAAWGYDLVYNSPSLSYADRERIRDHFIMPCVKQIMSSPAFIAAPANWSAIGCAAVMIGSRVCGDEGFYRKSIDGLPAEDDGPRKVAEAAAAAHAADPLLPWGKYGGIYFFLDKGIDDDGLWAEGSTDYQFMAMRGLVVMAEILWHDGLDVWSYRNGRMKLVFDSPIWMHYPGGVSCPAIHDGGSSSLFGRDAHLYQYAKRRYGDPIYDSILSRVNSSLESVYNLFLPACDFTPVAAVGLPPNPSVLFPGVGFAIVRTGDGADSRYLITDYGPSRSHGHPDKLNHCLYALGQEIFADGGASWYSTDIYLHYQNHTLAHNTVVANGNRQIPAGGCLEAYAQAGEIALMRATCDSAIPATILDRTLVMLGDRLYDLYRVHGSTPFTLDLPYHGPERLAVEGPLAAALKPWEHPDRKREGYTYFADPRSASWPGDWSCLWTIDNGSVRMHAFGELGTELVFAKTPASAGGNHGTVMLRRASTDTVFSTVCDIIPSGRPASVKTVRQVRNAAGSLVTTELVDGATEEVLVSSGAGLVSIGEVRTDAGMAALRRQGKVVESLILSGGTTFTDGAVTVKLSVPSLVSAYAVKPGLIRFTNHSPQPVMVDWSGLPATQVATLDAAGVWTGRIPIGKSGFTVAANSAVDLVADGQKESVAQFEVTQRREKQQKVVDAERQRGAALEADLAERMASAKREPLPAGSQILMEAEAFTAEGGGKVTVNARKVAAHGQSFNGWDGRDHWLEYTAEVAHTGWYQLGLRYCKEGDATRRSVLIDGQPMHPALGVASFPGTGGWSGGTDNWRLAPVCFPGTETPVIVRLEKGRHVLRLINTLGESMNLDYIVLAPAGVAMTRENVEK